MPKQKSRAASKYSRFKPHFKSTPKYNRLKSTSKSTLKPNYLAIWEHDCPFGHGFFAVDSVFFVRSCVSTRGRRGFIAAVPDYQNSLFDFYRIPLETGDSADSDFDDSEEDTETENWFVLKTDNWYRIESGDYFFADDPQFLVESS